MPPTLQELGIDRLSVADRLALAEAIWDSVAHESENPRFQRFSGKSWNVGWRTASRARMRSPLGRS